MHCRYVMCAHIEDESITLVRCDTHQKHLTTLREAGPQLVYTYMVSLVPRCSAIRIMAYACVCSFMYMHVPQ